MLSTTTSEWYIYVDIDRDVNFALYPFSISGLIRVIFIMEMKLK